MARRVPALRLGMSGEDIDEPADSLQALAFAVQGESADAGSATWPSLARECGARLERDGVHHRAVRCLAG